MKIADLLLPLRLIYRALPLWFRGWLRSSAARLVRRIDDRFFPGNQLALNDLLHNRIHPPAPPSTVTTEPAVPIDLTLVTHNSAKWIETLFSSLIRQHYPLDRVAVYVVDNDSIDDSLAMLKDWQRKLKGSLRAFEVFARANEGFGTGQNFAIAQGHADFVLVTNPDIEFEAESLSRILARAIADAPTVGSWELRQKPYEHPKHYDPVTQETNWSSHACILLRRSVWQQVAGYDQNLFLYGEDVEYSYRTRQAGYLLRYCPEAVVWHHTYATAGEVKPAQYIGSVIGNLYLRTKFGRPVDILGGISLIALQLFRREAFSGARLRLLQAALRTLIRTRAAPTHTMRKSVHFPLRGFDYELARHGSFFTLRAAPEKGPLVSIITRTYQGRARLLRQAARTVANQTYPGIEWIVVEDGGDTLRRDIEELRKETAPVIRYLALDKVGRSRAGNAGLAAARGEFLMFLDDDDLLYADHVEVLLNALLASPDTVAAYSLAWCLRTTMNGAGEIVDEHFDLPALFFQPYDYAVLRHHNYIPIQSILFRRMLYETRGGFETELDKLEDWNLWLRYAYRNTFEYLPKTTSLFRVPADPQAMGERQELIDQAIADARASADRHCLSYDNGV